MDTPRASVTSSRCQPANALAWPSGWAFDDGPLHKLEAPCDLNVSGSSISPSPTFSWADALAQYTSTPAVVKVRDSVNAVKPLTAELPRSARNPAPTPTTAVGGSPRHLSTVHVATAASPLATAVAAARLPQEPQHGDARSNGGGRRAGCGSGVDETCASVAKRTPAGNRALPPAAIATLRAWLDDPVHAGHPYPTAEEKEALAAAAGLTVHQVKVWFTNARKRSLVSSPRTLTAAEALSKLQQRFASPETARKSSKHAVHAPAVLSAQTHAVQASQGACPSPGGHGGATVHPRSIPMSPVTSETSGHARTLFAPAHPRAGASPATAGIPPATPVRTGSILPLALSTLGNLSGIRLAEAALSDAKAGVQQAKLVHAGDGSSSTVDCVSQLDLCIKKLVASKVALRAQLEAVQSALSALDIAFPAH